MGLFILWQESRASLTFEIALGKLPVLIIVSDMVRLFPGLVEMVVFTFLFFL